MVQNVAFDMFHFFEALDVVMVLVVLDTRVRK